MDLPEGRTLLEKASLWAEGAPGSARVLCLELAQQPIPSLESQGLWGRPSENVAFPSFPPCPRVACSGVWALCLWKTAR